MGLRTLLYLPDRSEIPHRDGLQTSRAPVQHKTPRRAAHQGPESSSENDAVRLQHLSRCRKESYYRRHSLKSPVWRAKHRRSRAARGDRNLSRPIASRNGPSHRTDPSMPGGRPSLSTTRPAHTQWMAREGDSL